MIVVCSMSSDGPAAWGMSQWADRVCVSATFFQGRSNEKDIQAILRHKGPATTENYIARMFPRENVFESALVKTERLETQLRFEPQKSEVPHGSPHFEWSSVKLQ
ncbi:MAG: hypothetical protein DESF_01491 [Desulfovibrio sp.]